jgi:hypothetical protein
MKKKHGTLSFYPNPLFLLYPFAARKQCLCSSFLLDSAGMGRRETKIIIAYRRWATSPSVKMGSVTARFTSSVQLPFLGCGNKPIGKLRPL